MEEFLEKHRRIQESLKKKKELGRVSQETYKSPKHKPAPKRSISKSDNIHKNYSNMDF